MKIILKNFLEPVDLHGLVNWAGEVLCAQTGHEACRYVR